MPDETRAEDALAPAVKERSTRRGDVPDGLARRYYTDGRGGDGLGFYVDARIQAPAFRDRGRELVANRADPNAIRDMVAIARHREWTIVTARGSAEFRREAWLTGRSAGLEVRGYRATERDLQELQRRQAAADRREAGQEWQEQRRQDRRDEREVREERREDAAARQRLRIVSAVVRDRVADPDRQSQIVAAARERIANWLDRGGRFDDLSQLRDRPIGRERVR
jgi:hypothetical protein